MRPVVQVLFLLLAMLAVVWFTAPDADTRASHHDDLARLGAWTGAADPCHDRFGGEIACDLAPAAGSGPGVIVVDLRDGATDADLAALSARLGVALAWVHPEARDEALAQGWVPDLAAAQAALRDDPTVEVAEPQLTLQLEDLPAPPSPPGVIDRARGWPDDPLRARQWNMDQIGAAAGWYGTPMGRGVVVAIIDTGVSPVEDLAGTTLLDGVSFVPGEVAWTDDNGHGTHVAGTVAQTTHNGVGVAGVAPAAAILPVKVLSRRGGGTSDQIAAGIDWAVDHGAHVINLSLGAPVYSAVVHTAAKKARDQGVLVVAAVGNSGRMGASYPGALAEVIGVSAVGPDGTLAPYSSWGLGTDIAAPGGDNRRPNGGVLQDTVTPDGHAYRELQGTSMASPHVAGALAALRSLPGVSPDLAEAAVLAGADGGVWDPRYGHGRLDLRRSLAVLGLGDDRPGRALLGLAMAVALGRLATSRRAWALLAGAVAAVVAGGLWWVPVTGPATGVLARGLLSWPVLVAGPTWGQAPIWVSALIPVAAAFALGPFKPLRPLALGVAAGVAAHLGHGMLHGTLAPWWMPGQIASVWLGINLVISVGAALAVVGVERVDRR